MLIGQLLRGCRPWLGWWREVEVSVSNCHPQVSPVQKERKGTESNGIGEILEENEKGKGITSPNWAEVDTKLIKMLPHLL